MKVLQCIFVTSRPVGNHQNASADGRQIEPINGDNNNESKSDSIIDSHNEKVISVRVTSSVAIGRTKGKQPKIFNNNREILLTQSPIEITTTKVLTLTTETLDITENNDMEIQMTELPPELIGANIEFIKQLDAKKKTKDQNLDQIHPCELLNKHHHNNENEEILEESSSSIDEHDDSDETEEIPFSPKILSSTYVNENKNPTGVFIVDDTEPSKLEEQKNISSKYDPFVETSLDVLFSNGTQNNNKDTKNIKQLLPLTGKPDTSIYDQLERNQSEINQNEDSLAESSLQSTVEVAAKRYDNNAGGFNPQISAAAVSQQSYFQDFSNNKPLNGRRGKPRLTTVSFNIVHDAPQVPTTNSQPIPYLDSAQTLVPQQTNYQSPKIYSEPAKIYSEPAKFYSEPAKIYSEPAKVYSEPAKIYSEPAKIYSVPAKFYSKPASLNLEPSVAPNLVLWQQQSQTPFIDTTTINTTPTTTVDDTIFTTNSQNNEQDHQPEKNYEVDENVSVITNGRSHGVQETTTETCKEDNCKVGYVVEGRQFKKYRVEERTSDGFIVGEYGVVRNEDGALRGVRYTADSDASPRLISDALMKFLQLR